MNAAEITDKLGLHSLRQRAWVSSAPDRVVPRTYADGYNSTSKLLALLLVMVCTRVLSGLPLLSERPAISKRCHLASPAHVHFRLPRSSWVGCNMQVIPGAVDIVYKLGIFSVFVLTLVVRRSEPPVSGMSMLLI